MARVGEVVDTEALRKLKAKLFARVSEWTDSVIPPLAANLAILEQLSGEEVEVIYQELTRRVHGKAIDALKGEDALVRKSRRDTE